MAKKQNKTIDTIKSAAKKGAESIDVEAIKSKAAVVGAAALAKAVEAGGTIAERTGELKDAAASTKDDIVEKLNELNTMLEQSITDYNDAYTQMNDKGIRLYVERCRSVDTISFVEMLINSIANRPKSFDSDFAEIKMNRSKFTESCEFAKEEIKAARTAAGGAGAGLAAGASVAFMGPTAAMWVATTFGTASTGTAISALSGAAATNAALAWLGGGTLALGGGGMAAGNAFLAMAGPIGWTIAGASLLGSLLLFANKRNKTNKQKNEEIEKVKKNTETIKEMDAQIVGLMELTYGTREGVSELYTKAVSLFGKDYAQFTDEQKMLLGSLVNSTKALSALFGTTIGSEGDANE